jgi:hypothetical protein
VQWTYDQAVEWSATAALEVDVWPTTDGVWVVSHDQTTDIFNQTLTITSSTWAQLQGLTTTVGGYPIMRFDAWLARYATGNRVVFVDNKGVLNTSNLLTLLASYGGSGRFVIKGYITSVGWPEAAVAVDPAYQSWGYGYDADVASNFPTYQSHWTTLGMDVTASSSDWTSVLSYGKLVIGHIADSAAQAATGFSLGASGIMASDVRDVIPQTPIPASVSGAGSMTVVPSSGQQQTVTTVGSGAVTVAASAMFSAVVAGTGAGSISVSASTAGTVNLSITGSGGLTTAIVPGYSAACNVTGQGALAVAYAAAQRMSVSITGFGVVVPRVGNQPQGVYAGCVLSRPWRGGVQVRPWQGALI